MFLSDAERDALLRVGKLTDRQGRFDKNVAFNEHQVLTLRDLQDKGLVAKEHAQYYLTPAGQERLDEVKQAQKCMAERAEEKRHEKNHEWAKGVVLAVVSAIVTVVVSLLFPLLFQ